MPLDAIGSNPVGLVSDHGFMSADWRPAEPLVGREPELERLLAATGVTEPEARGGVLLSGDAGIGKTRLLRELAARAADTGHRVLAGHCLDLGDSAIPFQPFAQVLAALDDTTRKAMSDAMPPLGPLDVGSRRRRGDRSRRALLVRGGGARAARREPAGPPRGRGRSLGRRVHPPPHPLRPLPPLRRRGPDRRLLPQRRSPPSAPAACRRRGVDPAARCPASGLGTAGRLGGPRARALPRRRRGRCPRARGHRAARRGQCLHRGGAARRRRQERSASTDSRRPAPRTARPPRRRRASGRPSARVRRGRGGRRAALRRRRPAAENARGGRPRRARPPHPVSDPQRRLRLQARPLRRGRTRRPAAG